MTLPKVAIAHQTIVDGDAVGNDIRGMFTTLLNNGYNTGLISEYISDPIKRFHLNQIKIKQFLENPDSVLIYHHSIFWEWGEELLEQFKGLIFFKFHNITPPHFFSNYSSLHYEKCHRGIEQTIRLISKYPDVIWWADSDFNAGFLQDLGADPKHTVILPPFNQIEKLKGIEPDFRIIDSLINNNCNNILFVGRVAPNKGHKHLIETIKRYKESYHPEVHLWILGEIDREYLGQYFNQLSELIHHFRLEKNISFIGKIPDAEVKAYFLACDEYLCMSEHEGFCVPIIEAQEFSLPVVTFGGTALRETTGRNQIILDTLDYDLTASALFTVYHDEKIKRFCKKHGLINVNSRFSPEKISNAFLCAFNPVMKEAVQ
jgi:glycosyltransferase involved in cell wall biosynthesis